MKSEQSEYIGTVGLHSDINAEVYPVAVKVTTPLTPGKFLNASATESAIALGIPFVQLERCCTNSLAKNLMSR